MYCLTSSKYFSGNYGNAIFKECGCIISDGSRIFPRGVRQLPKVLFFFSILSPKTA